MKQLDSEAALKQSELVKDEATGYSRNETGYSRKMNRPQQQIRIHPASGPQKEQKLICEIPLMSRIQNYSDLESSENESERRLYVPNRTPN